MLNGSIVHLRLPLTRELSPQMTEEEKKGDHQGARFRGCASGGKVVLQKFSSFNVAFHSTTPCGSVQPSGVLAVLDNPPKKPPANWQGAFLVGHQGLEPWTTRL